MSLDKKRTTGSLAALPEVILAVLLETTDNPAGSHPVRKTATQG